MHIRMTASQNHRPREGDRRMINGVEHVRRRKVLLNRLGKPIGYDRWRGFDWFSWVPA